ncbi:hypothetical protein [Myxococcus sp. RHSTA-1-4]|uniref:hypothetical protein n=1 Tax=Myxococcus sp. RHSTA-1-4 TaxID=2874601 RepID=UPI001CBC13A5|nr:hypothetical protein [Myxococcus sp. RHSTA-1-4]MBZ4420172.1 hypothetical protein [Myxococcus sp. RHSTA-1-4]
MPSSNPLRPKLLKGVFVKLGEAALVPVPEVILFQYNPELLSRTLEPWTPPGDQASDAQKAGSADTAQPQDPGETLSLSLELDATDALEEPDTHPVAVLSGVSDRVYALEMLLYPRPAPGEGLLSSAVASLAGALGVSTSTPEVPRSEVPIILFIWGPGRMLPVRLTSFSVEEQAFLPNLSPLRAKVTVGMQVLGPAFFEQRRKALGTLSSSEALAEKAYEESRRMKARLASLNIANSVESALGMLPLF